MITLQPRDEEVTNEENRPAGEHAAAPGASAAPPHKRERGLLAIGLFKLGKAIFFFCVGLGAMHLVHANLGDLTLRMATALHFDIEGQFVSMLQDRADLISGHQLRQASILSIGYSMIALVEGVGLMMQKVWAEYLTTILTAGALPWELFEIAKHPTGLRFGLLLLNVLVLIYLIWLLKRNRKKAAALTPAAH